LNAGAQLPLINTVLDIASLLNLSSGCVGFAFI
jgi:hypothetical protein